MKKVLICCLLCFSASCSQYDWSPSELAGADTAPVVSAGADLSLSDADNLDQAYTVPVNLSDPDTPLGNVTVTWSQNASNPGPVSITANAGDYEMFFPYNGVYQLTVTADDGEQTSQDSLVITVSASNVFAIDGSVTDNLSAVVNAPVTLRFSDGTIIKNDQSNASGQFTFNGLIGSVTNYEVLVQ